MLLITAAAKRARAAVRRERVCRFVMITFKVLVRPKLELGHLVLATDVPAANHANCWGLQAPSQRPTNLTLLDLQTDRSLLKMFCGRSFYDVNGWVEGFDV